MATFSNIHPVIILKSLFVILYTYGVIFTSTEACEGYQITLKKLEPAGQNDVLKFTNPKVSLTKDCRVILSGCVDIKGFSRCQVTYDVKKKGMMVPFKGERDVCEEYEKACKESDTAARVKSYNLEMKCPIKSRHVCAKKGESIDISQYKDKFRLASGQYSGTLTFECDSGKSVYKFECEFKRGK